MSQGVQLKPNSCLKNKSLKKIVRIDIQVLNFLLFRLFLYPLTVIIIENENKQFRYMNGLDGYSDNNNKQTCKK